MDYNQLARMLRMQPSVDSAGQPVDMKRPIVFDKGGYDPHTELSITGTGQEFGLPQKNAFFATQKAAFFATSSEAPLLLDTLPRDSGAESAYSGVFSER